MSKAFAWAPQGAGWRAEMPGDVTLWAEPVATVLGFKPKRGTKWRAGASHWDASTRTISRHGRDLSGQEFSNAKAAMTAAAAIFQEASQCSAES